jgi:hypothetical protein
VRRFVVDTNVPIVANGRADSANDRLPSIACKESTVKFLVEVLQTGKVLLDIEGEIQKEYRTYLNPSGQPGVGDRFYLEVLRSAPSKIERRELPKDVDGEYLDLPRQLIEAEFDRSDRKFAALAKRTAATVANATDSDWLIHRETIVQAGIRLKFVCGLDCARWFKE